MCVGGGGGEGGRGGGECENLAILKRGCKC